MHVQVDTYPIGGSHMSRNARTPAPPSRRIALGFGTAAGAAVIAASFSMGTAPVAGADVSDADAVSSLAGALDPSAFSAESPTVDLYRVVRRVGEANWHAQRGLDWSAPLAAATTWRC